MSWKEIVKPRVKLPINPFLFKQSHNLLYQVGLLTGTSLIFLLLSLYYYLPPLGFADVWWGIPGGLMLVVAVLLFTSLRRHRNLTPLDEVYPEVNDLTTKLAARRFLMCEPPPKVYLTNSNTVAQTWSRHGESYIAVGQHFAHKLDRDPQLWSAILLHEMSHLRNGDIPMRFTNMLVFFYTSLLLLGLGAWGVIWGGGYVIPLEGLILAVFLFLLQLWALFRAQLGAEAAADLRTTLAIGDNRGILEALRQLRLSRRSWQGGVLEAREAMLLNLADPSQQRMSSFLIYGLAPLLSALCLMVGIVYLSGSGSVVFMQQSTVPISGLLMTAMGLGLYWAVHDLESSIIALGFKSLFPIMLVFIMGESIAVATFGFLFPEIPLDQLITTVGGMLIILGWALLLLLKEFKSGAPIPAVLRWHNNRLTVAGIVVPIITTISFIIFEAAGYSINPFEAPSILGLSWFITICLWFWLESFRFLPRAIAPANWSQPLAESPPDRAIDLSPYKPLTREQEIAMGCFDTGFISIIAGVLGLSLGLNGSVMIVLCIVMIAVGFYIVNSSGRRSWGAWLLGATVRVGHRKPPTDIGSALSIVRLLLPAFHGGDPDWAAVEGPRLSSTATLWLGIVFASAGATMLFLRLAEVL